MQLFLFPLRATGEHDAQRQYKIFHRNYFLSQSCRDGILYGVLCSRILTGRLIIDCGDSELLFQRQSGANQNYTGAAYIAMIRQKKLDCTSFRASNNDISLAKHDLTTARRKI